MSLEFFSVKTPILFPPKDNVFSLFDAEGFLLKSGDILCITTKCLAIHQGRCVRIGTVDKRQLVKDEADRVLSDGCLLTIKDDAFIPFSGIDESNGNGYYVLWPKDIAKLLHDIHRFLCKKFNIENLGIISVDSKIEPLRRGTIGVAQSIYGFDPIKDYRGNVDIFGRELKLTSVNIADSLASSACFLMGEGNECCPLVIIRGVENITFGENFTMQSLKIDRADDMFSGIFNC
jgi:F420-0:gamma-glutamyl ligase